MKLALDVVLLDTALSFDRNDIAMSTLVASPDWRFEAEWDGSRIGDVQMYKRSKAGEWEWYGAVPCAKVKGYRWTHGEPKAESRKAGKGAGEVKPFSGDS